MSNTIIARARTRSTSMKGAVGAEAAAAPTTQTTGERFYQATMTPEKFGTFLTHPRQRDILRHAEAAKRKHLSGFNITQANVAAASFEGKFYKLDGHTRSHLWESGSLQKPDKVTVTIYNCTSYDELLNLYATFDNKYAAENGSDILSGVMREAGIEVRSAMFKNYKFLTALKYAYAHAHSNSRVRFVGGTDSPEALARYVNFFKDEIRMLDGIDPALRIFKAGVTAGAFLALKRRGDSVLPFFEALNTNRGTKTESECDGIQALHDLIMQGNYRARIDTALLTSRTISCVESWRAGRTYSLSRLGVAGVKNTDLAEYTKTMVRDRPARDDGATVARARPAIETILPANL